MWVDSHCHLQPGHARGHVAADLIARAMDQGVDWMVCVGTDLASSRDAVELAANHECVHAVVGLHPHDAEQFSGEWAELRGLAAAGSKVVGIGETGFDLYYEHSPRDEQRVAFIAQIELAHELDRALVIHTRDAWDDTFDVLTEVGVPTRTIVHCFSGGPKEAARAIELGCYLSYSGVIAAAARRSSAALNVTIPEYDK